MTREEAIKVLQGEVWINCQEKWFEALDMAIKALEQEPCDDAVSREAVLKIIDGWYENNRDTENIEDLIILITYMSSVNPQEQKTGYWIMPVQDDGMSDPIYYQVRCSKCGFDLDPQTWHMELHQYGADKYCPNCGCRMVEPQENDHKCHTCKHYTSGEQDGSCDSYICKGYSDWESDNCN